MTKRIPLLALVCLLGACSKAPPKFLGVAPGMSCKDFAQAMFPLHQNYKKLTKLPDASSLKMGTPVLTESEFVDSCLNAKWVYVATDAGTPLQYTIDGPGVTGYEVTLESWISWESFRATYMVRGQVEQGAEAWKRWRGEIQTIFDPYFKELGAPLLHMRCGSNDDPPLPVWRRGSYLIHGCRAGLVVREAEKEIRNLRDSPDIEPLLEALRKDGLKGI